MSRRARWTLAIVSIALFMTTLDNLVVSTALPSIRKSLGASIESLEWTVNAYTLSFAVLLLTGAALGDRFGRRRMFVAGISVFTLSSAAAALAPTTDALVAARAVQGAGVDLEPDRGLDRRRPGSAGRLRRVGAARRGADAADALLPLARLRRHERRVAGDVLRGLRVDLPAGAVLPDRGGLLAARGGSADAALDREADVRRADRASAP